MSLAVFVLLAAIFLGGLSGMQAKTEEQQIKLLADALHRAAVSCFAIEGQYPASVQYILDNYGVVYDENKYIIVYQVFASNIAPTIQVLPIGAGGDEASL